MKNYRDNIDLAGSAPLTVVTNLRELAQSLLPAVRRDVDDLNKTKPADPHDFLRNPNEIADPKVEIARIKSDLHLMVKRLDEAESLIKQNRALLAELLV